MTDALMRKRSAIVFVSALVLIVAGFALAVQRNRRQFWLDRHLCSAVRVGELERIRDLLAQGADPNARDNFPPAPSGFFSRMMSIIRSERADASHFTVLHLAIELDQRDVFNTLLQAGADVNAPLDGTGKPLICAASHGDSEMVRQLLYRGANPNEVVKRRRRRYPVSALEEVAEKCDGATFEEMLKRGGRLEPQPRGNSLLGRAARNEDSTALRLLLDRGYDPNTVSEGLTPLMHAATCGRPESVELLIDRGAAINARYHGPNKMTALNFAEESRTQLRAHEDLVAGYDSAIRMLKAHGAK